MKRLEQPESVKAMAPEKKQEFLKKLRSLMQKAERSLAMMQALEAMISGRLITDGEYAHYTAALRDKA